MNDKFNTEILKKYFQIDCVYYDADDLYEDIYQILNKHQLEDFSHTIAYVLKLHQTNLFWEYELGMSSANEQEAHRKLQGLKELRLIEKFILTSYNEAVYRVKSGESELDVYSMMNIFSSITFELKPDLAKKIGLNEKIKFNGEQALKTISKSLVERFFSEYSESHNTLEISHRINIDKGLFSRPYTEKKQNQGTKPYDSLLQDFCRKLMYFLRDHHPKASSTDTNKPEEFVSCIVDLLESVNLFPAPLDSELPYTRIEKNKRVRTMLGNKFKIDGESDFS